MRTLLPVLALALVLCGGCVYEVPVTPDHAIPVDPAMVGLWQAVPEPGQAEAPDERMLVLQYSETEYAIRYPSGKDAMYFRGYPIKVGNLRCVQVQLIGAEDRPVKDGDRKYQVVTCQLADGVLEVRTLNPDVISKAATTSADLARAIRANLADPALFKDPGRFRKVVQE